LAVTQQLLHDARPLLGDLRRGLLNCEIVIQVARAEPTTGTVVEAGVQRLNDNGSADVPVAATIKSTSPHTEDERKLLDGHDY